MIARSRGAVCIFPQGQEQPVWVPARLTRELKRIQDNEDDPRGADSPPVDANDKDENDAPVGSNQGMANTYACSR